MEFPTKPAYIFLGIFGGIFLLCTIISSAVNKNYQEDWDDWHSTMCLEWNTVQPDKDPVFCQIVTHIQEPISQTGSSWVSAVCKCADASCLHSHVNNGTEVQCWYEPKDSDEGLEHAKVQLGSHPDTDPEPSRRAFITFLVLTCIFGSVIVSIYAWQGKCRKHRGMALLTHSEGEYHSGTI